MKLIIQIPCYNEEKTLEATLNDLPVPGAISGIDKIEYLIINDGSEDGTTSVARRWAKERGRTLHIVSFKRNRGLACGFMAGLDACLKLGADIIVNTDADNQYCGADIEKLISPILGGGADIVIGERPIEQTAHFSPLKKKLQRLGSWVVQKAAKAKIPDAPSGFRAYSRDAAMRLNVFNEYTYTLETIIQAGREKIAMASVPIRTNAETRPSRLFNSMFGYVRKSAVTILRAFMMYKPMRFFSTIGAIVFGAGFAIGVLFLFHFFTGDGGGHVQSLILASTLMLIGFQTIVIGWLADIIASNRKLLEDIQYRVRKMEYGKSNEEEP